MTPATTGSRRSGSSEIRIGAHHPSPLSRQYPPTTRGLPTPHSPRINDIGQSVHVVRNQLCERLRPAGVAGPDRGRTRRFFVGGVRSTHVPPRISVVFPRTMATRSCQPARPLPGSRSKHIPRAERQPLAPLHCLGPGLTLRSERASTSALAGGWGRRRSAAGSDQIGSEAGRVNRTGTCRPDRRGRWRSHAAGGDSAEDEDGCVCLTGRACSTR